MVDVGGEERLSGTRYNDRQADFRERVPVGYFMTVKSPLENLKQISADVCLKWLA